MSDYKPSIAWSTIVTDVTTHSTAFNFVCKVPVNDVNDSGYDTLSVGDYLADYAGNIYEIKEIIDAATNEIRVYDINEYAISTAPYENKIGYIYRPFNDAPVIAPIDMYLLGQSARDNINTTEKYVYWNNRGLEIDDGTTDSTNVTKLVLTTGLVWADSGISTGWNGGREATLSFEITGGVTDNFVTIDANDNLQDSGITNSDLVHITGDETISGIKTFSDNVFINGDLTVSGTYFTNNVETLLIKDNLAIINFGETGSGITEGFAGWEADRGTVTPYRWGYNEVSDTWELGEYYIELTTGTITGTLTLHEEIIQATSSARGYIYATDNSSYVRLKGVTGTFDTTNLVTGQSSGATFTPSVVTTTDSLQAVATREDTPTDGYYAYWDAATNMFKTNPLSSLNYWTLNGTDLYYTGGYVGVNQSTPTAELDVVGRINLVDSLNNVFVGNAGNSTLTGVNNTVIGNNSLRNNTTGYGNLALAYQSLYSNTTGYFNVGIGYQSLYSNTTGYFNVGIGYQSLYSNNGIGNLAIGKYSLYNNSSGHHNTILGDESAGANITGYYNVGIGHQNLYSNTTGYSNTVIGTYSLYYNVSGISNTILGFGTGQGITTGNYNTIIGANVTGLSSSLSNNIILANGSGIIRYQDDNGIGEFNSTLRIKGSSAYADSALLPSLTISDNDTGWYKYDVDTLRLSISGSDLIEYTGSGIDVTGTINASTDITINGSSVLTNGSHWTLSGTDLYYTGGNVGIGTSSPSEKLGVYESSTTGTYLRIQKWSDASGGSLALRISDLSSSIPIWNFNTGSSQDISFGSSGSESMRITSSGGVGIGTSSPSEVLEVVGDIQTDWWNSKYFKYKTVRSDPTADKWYHIANITLTSSYDQYSGVFRVNGRKDTSTSTSFGLEFVVGIGQGGTTTAGSSGATIVSLGSYGGYELNAALVLTTNSDPTKVYELYVQASSISYFRSHITIISSNPFNGATFEIVENDTGVSSLPSGTQTTMTRTIDFNSNGYVGIGTTSPSTKLEVSGVITATGGTSTDWNTAYSWGDWHHTTLSGYGITDAYTKTETDAKYLLNTTDTFTGTLSITGALSVSSTITQGGTAVSLEGHTHTESDITDLGTYLENGDQWTLSGTDLYYTGGNVGIGTSTPSKALEVSSSSASDGLSISSTYNNPSLSLNIQNTGDSYTLGIYFNGWNASSIETSLARIAAYQTANAASGDLRFYTADGGTLSEAMRIDKDGNVGIGTTSPSTALDVSGVITATGGTSTDWNTAYSWGNHASAGYITSSGVTYENLDANGDVGTGAGQLAIGNHTHSYEPIITAGTTSQYWRGDKTWQTLNMTSLSDVSISGISSGDILKWDGSNWIHSSYLTFGTANYQIPFVNGQDFSYDTDFTWNSKTLVISDTGGSVFIGKYAGSNDDNNNYNVGIGYNALHNNTSGYSNTVIGYNSGKDISTGYSNSFFGSYSGTVATGNYNSFFGHSSGALNTTGVSNVAVGYTSGYNITTGSYNSLLGTEVAGDGTVILTGDYNTLLGYKSGYLLQSSASGNILLGAKAGDNITTANYSVIIGYDIDPSSVTTNGQFVLGSNGNILLDGIMTSGSEYLLVKGDLEVEDTFILNNSSYSITADGFTISAPSTSYLKLTSSGTYDSSSATAISNGSYTGQILVIQYTSGYNIVIFDNANTKLAGNWSPLTYDTITLIWDGNDWVELSRSDN